MALIRKSKRPLSGLLFCSVLGVLVPTVLRADIIDDISELEKPKKKSNTEEEEGQSPEASGENIEAPKTREPAAPARGSTRSPVPGSAPEKGAPSSKSSSPNKATEAEDQKETTAANKAEREARRKLPIHLASEGTSTYSQNGSFVHLEKNVIITQDDIRIQANEAKIKMAKESGGVDVAEMLGKVSLVRSSKDPGERINAYGDRALFENDSQLVTLEGNARLLRDGHLVKGDKIIYEIVTGMVKVDRVQGVVRPERADK